MPQHFFLFCILFAPKIISYALANVNIFVDKSRVLVYVFISDVHYLFRHINNNTGAKQFARIVIYDFDVSRFL